jgi:hypothetical protein
MGEHHEINLSNLSGLRRISRWIRNRERTDVAQYFAGKRFGHDFEIPERQSDFFTVERRPE